MQDQLSQYMLDSYLNQNIQDSNPAANNRRLRVYEILDALRAGKYPVVYSEFHLKQVQKGIAPPDFIETPRLQYFVTMYRMVLGKPDHTPAELIMEDAIVLQMRRSQLDILDYVASNLVDHRVWEKSDQQFKDGYVNIARNLVIGAIERGARNA